ncbi:MAG: hypothetical protein F6K22_02050 [Okeania sp. SIO2F4]|uniref:hypothetical protein n=1 Tax=Okeania sp. SIO2F4 TaxID=2607790 RepID=UPI00142C2095|nr:hypothetical protein [Okeania sp. SIO2F4]NES01709.1 hypothetical protein [Okeania sp. SIO2F4]
MHKAIELANNLRKNGYHKIINPEIQTKTKSCIELLERITDDNDDDKLVEIAPLPKKRETAETLPTKHNIYGYSQPDYSAWNLDPSSSLVMA